MVGSYHGFVRFEIGVPMVFYGEVLFFCFFQLTHRGVLSWDIAVYTGMEKGTRWDVEGMYW